MRQTHLTGRQAECEPRRLLLRTLSGERGEPGPDAADRRVAYATSGLWAYAPDGSAAAGGFARQREANWAVDAGDGAGGDLLQTRSQGTEHAQ